MANNSLPLDRLFHSLADPTRRAVIERLARGPASVSELAPATMSLPSFVQHLKVLEEAGLIRSTKSGRVRTCEIEPQALEALEGWIAEQRRYWEARFDRLEAYLKELKSREKDDDANG